MNKDIKYLIEKLFDDNEEILDNNDLTLDELNISDNLETYKFIDLGLPSGTLWCDRNIGAKSPEDTGKFFQWGRIDGCYDGDTDFKFSTDFPPETASGKKYYKNSRLKLEDDAAYMNSSRDQKMPSDADVTELLIHTIHAKFENKGKKGFLFISKNNNNSIFIPLTSFYYYDRDIENVCNANEIENLLLWCSGDTINEFYAKFFRGKYNNGDCFTAFNLRNCAYPVRGIKIKTT